MKIFPDNLPRPAKSFSPGIKKGKFVFVSGQVPVNSAGEVIGKGDIKAQTEQTLENVKSVLEAAGAVMENVVKTTVYLTDPGNYELMDEVYSKYFKNGFPARSTIIASLVRKDALVEIEAAAVLD